MGPTVSVTDRGAVDAPAALHNPSHPDRARLAVALPKLPMDCVGVILTFVASARTFFSVLRVSRQVNFIDERLATRTFVTRVSINLRFSPAAGVDEADPELSFFQYLPFVRSVEFILQYDSFERPLFLARALSRLPTPEILEEIRCDIHLNMNKPLEGLSEILPRFTALPPFALFYASSNYGDRSDLGCCDIASVSQRAFADCAAGLKELVLDRLENYNIQSMTLRFVCDNFVSLQTLSLFRCQISLPLLKELPRTLRHLTLHRVMFHPGQAGLGFGDASITCRDAESLPACESFVFESVNVEPDFLDGIPIDNVRKLVLKRLQKRRIAAASFERETISRFAPTLEVLELFSHMGSMPGMDLGSDWPRLRVISISGMTPKQADDLLRVVSMPALKEMTIKSVRSSKPAPFDSERAFPGVKLFKFEPADQGSTRFLGSLALFPNLQRLEFKGKTADLPQGACLSFDLPLLSTLAVTLRSLQLSYVNVSDRDLEFLVNLEDLKIALCAGFSGRFLSHLTRLLTLDLTLTFSVNCAWFPPSLRDVVLILPIARVDCGHLPVLKTFKLAALDSARKLKLSRFAVGRAEVVELMQCDLSRVRFTRRVFPCLRRLSVGACVGYDERGIRAILGDENVFMTFVRLPPKGAHPFANVLYDW